jgi:hypothetical protein
MLARRELGRKSHGDRSPSNSKSITFSPLGKIWENSIWNLNLISY